MYSESFIQLALDLLACNQKELAAQLGVSPTQVSKWKKGDYLSFEMEVRLRELMGIGQKQPELILQVGGLDAAAKWERLTRFIAMAAIEQAETGYNTEPLAEHNELLCWSTVHTLAQMGVEIPKEFPQELNVDFDDPDLDWAFADRHPISALIKAIYCSLNDVYGFYVGYVLELLEDDATNLLGTSADNIEPCLIELAASKLDVDEVLAKNFRRFQGSVNSNYEEWLDKVKEAAFRVGIPIRAELLDLVYKTHDEVGHLAEAESLGFNKYRAHPDVYMNELLEGMRAIHRVLPAIMMKLGISDELERDI